MRMGGAQGATLACCSRESARILVANGVPNGYVHFEFPGTTEGASLSECLAEARVVILPWPDAKVYCGVGSLNTSSMSHQIGASQVREAFSSRLCLKTCHFADNPR
jgi:hypothetical protein